MLFKETILLLLIAIYCKNQFLIKTPGQIMLESFYEILQNKMLTAWSTSFIM